MLERKFTLKLKPKKLKILKSQKNINTQVFEITLTKHSFNNFFPEGV